LAVKARVRRIGTSLGIIIPKEKLEEMRVKEGDVIVIPRIEKPVKEIRGILKGTTFHFEREHTNRDEHIEKAFAEAEER
jgi:antitoxin component of MazEF toxin-antitoxin module